MSLQREASNDEGEADGAEAVALEEGHEVAETDEHHDRHADVRVIEGDGKVVPVLGLWGEGVSNGLFSDRLSCYNARGVAFEGSAGFLENLSIRTRSVNRKTEVG